MSTDPTAITTEIPVTAATPSALDTPPGPADRSQALPRAQGAAQGSGGAGASAGAQQQQQQQQPPGVEPCPHCGTPLALDQRYCLECGAPRTYLSGMLLERLRAPVSAQGSAAQATPAPPGSVAPPGSGSIAPNGVVSAFGAQSAAGGGVWQRGSVLTLIASIGVLLLAMGVGVLIGRSGGSSSSSSAPQVVTVPAAAGAANTTTTPTTPEATNPAAKSGAAATGAAAAAKHKAKAAESGVGQTPSKPAPPTVLKNLRTGSGQSYEQKSKNLPNVVSTG